MLSAFDYSTLVVEPVPPGLVTSGKLLANEGQPTNHTVTPTKAQPFVPCRSQGRVVAQVTYENKGDQSNPHLLSLGCEM